MGQYKFQIDFKWQIGILIEWNIDEIWINLPGIYLYFGLTPQAVGIVFFGKEVKNKRMPPR